MLKNGPELAQLQIRLLDQLIAQLKQRRMDVGEHMERDKEELGWIRKGVRYVMNHDLSRFGKYQPKIDSVEERIGRETEMERGTHTKKTNMCATV